MISNEFIITLPSFMDSEAVTKRWVLSHIASVFDPCGYICPALLSAKALQSKIWANETKSKWDDPISESLKSEFLKIVSEWTGIEFKFPRKNISSNISEGTRIQIHGFSDALQIGLGIAIYVRAINQKIIESSLIFARSLVVPSELKPKPTKSGVIREVSISRPRLELQATKLLAKTTSQIAKFLEIKIESINLWTDSSSVIQWLKNKENKDVFVRNRTPIIREYRVRHVSGEENPANVDPVNAYGK